MANIPHIKTKKQAFIYGIAVGVTMTYLKVGDGQSFVEQITEILNQLSADELPRFPTDAKI